MQIRRLNEAGVLEFRNQLAEIRSGSRSELDHSLISGKDFSEEFYLTVEIEQKEFSNKKDLSAYLVDILNLRNNRFLYYDVGMWTWLSVVYFDLLCPKNAQGKYNVKADARYILADPKNWRRYYRHLLACPARIYCELGEVATPFLSSQIHIWGEFHEQLSAYQDIATNKPLMESANALYWDPMTLKLKKGSGSKGPGTPRRFSDLVGQFELTFDLNVMPSNNFLNILPGREFGRWTNAT